MEYSILQLRGGPHLITYTANDGNGCTNSADIVVEVVPLMTAEITPEEHCVERILLHLLRIHPEESGEA